MVISEVTELADTELGSVEISSNAGRQVSGIGAGVSIDGGHAVANA